MSVAADSARLTTRLEKLSFSPWHRRLLLLAFFGTLFDAAVYRTYGSILVEERFTPAGFKAPLAMILSIASGNGRCN